MRPGLLLRPEADTVSNPLRATDLHAQQTMEAPGPPRLTAEGLNSTEGKNSHSYRMHGTREAAIEHGSRYILQTVGFSERQNRFSAVKMAIPLRKARPALLPVEMT